MGYVESEPLFLATTEMVKDWTNITMYMCGTAPFRLLSKLVETPPLARDRKQ